MINMDVWINPQLRLEFEYQFYHLWCLDFKSFEYSILLQVEWIRMPHVPIWISWKFSRMRLYAAVTLTTRYMKWFWNLPFGNTTPDVTSPSECSFRQTMSQHHTFNMSDHCFRFSFEMWEEGAKYKSKDILIIWQISSVNCTMFFWTWQS